MRPKPRQDLARLRLTMIALGIAIERKDALAQVLALHGHRAAAARAERWLDLYLDWYGELVRRCREAANAELIRYIEQLKRQVPFLPTDSLDQESAPQPTRSAAAEIAAKIAAMNEAEIKYAELGPGGRHDRAGSHPRSLQPDRAAGAEGDRNETATPPGDQGGEAGQGRVGTRFGA